MRVHVFLEHLTTSKSVQGKPDFSARWIPDAMTWLAAARTAASAAIRGCKTQLNNATHQQTRNMGELSFGTGDASIPSSFALKIACNVNVI